jgi:hypothetical protein
MNSWVTAEFLATIIFKSFQDYPYFGLQHQSLLDTSKYHYGAVGHIS